MIIAFYPGAGGHRYSLYIKGLTEFEPNRIYDRAIAGPEDSASTEKFVYRYLDQSTLGLPNKELIYTHCMNVPLLKKHFPEQKEIIVLQAPMLLCLRRQWYLIQQHHDKDMDDKYEDAYAHIAHHARYYQQYPVDLTGATQIIDIEHGTGEFEKMMLNELNSIESQEFDRAASDHVTGTELKDLPGDKIVDGFKSKFLDDAEKMKLQLDKISPSMCLAKWKQVSLHLPTGMNNSCYHPPLHKIDVSQLKTNPSKLHNTNYKKLQRQMMLNGQRPAECQYCWNMEDNGKLSDRHYRSGEPWASKDFGKIVASAWDEDINPSYVEVNFNNACNLKCSYCSPQFSSSWQAEVDRDGAYPTAVPHNAPEHFTGERKPIANREENPYVDAFWQWWPDLYPELEHFRMTGGEPLMDKNTYRVFDHVIANPNKKLHLNVTSNFSVEPALFDKYMTYVKTICDGRIEHFMQYVSVDAWAQRAEYIRNGLDFELMWNRVDQFLTEIPSHNSLTFIITMNNLSVTSLKELLQGILDLRKKHSTTYQRVWFDTPVLRQPEWQSLQILPHSYVNIMQNTKQWMEQNIETAGTRLHGFKDYEIQRMDRDIAWMQSGQGINLTQAVKHQADFYRFFNEHDRRRGTDFLKTFPEMTAWWKTCEYYAKQS